jgi:hypothetical protein
MPFIEFTDQQVQQLTNMLANTREWPWVVTNPLLVTITQSMERAAKQLQPAGAPPRGNNNSEKYDRRLPD